MDTIREIRELAQQTVDAFAAGWDDKGLTGLREPYRWETVARVSLDMLRAIATVSPESTPTGTVGRTPEWRENAFAGIPIRVDPTVRKDAIGFEQGGQLKRAIIGPEPASAAPVRARIERAGIGWCAFTHSHDNSKAARAAAREALTILVEQKAATDMTRLPLTWDYLIDQLQAELGAEP